MLYIDTQLLFGKVTDMTLARTHDIILPEKLTDGLSLSRRLHDNQIPILTHIC